MAKYICEPCRWIYDEEKGDSEGGIVPCTEFKDLPYDWVCPLCGFGVEVFSRIR